MVILNTPLCRRRGAELINTNLIRMVEIRRSQEEEGLARVKRKMERIKLRQERLHQKVPFDSDDHFVGKSCGLVSRPIRGQVSGGSWDMILWNCCGEFHLLKGVDCDCMTPELSCAVFR